jgi:hypothetical protein
MSAIATEIFQAGTAIYIEMECKDKDGSLIDPESGPTITLTDATGTVKVDKADMTKKDVGVYWYIYQSLSNDAPGVWNDSFAATASDGSKGKSVPTPVFELVA